MYLNFINISGSIQSTTTLHIIGLLKEIIPLFPMQVWFLCLMYSSILFHPFSPPLFSHIPLPSHTVYLLPPFRLFRSSFFHYHLHFFLFSILLFLPSLAHPSCSLSMFLFPHFSLPLFGFLSFFLLLSPFVPLLCPLLPSPILSLLSHSFLSHSSTNNIVFLSLECKDSLWKLVKVNDSRKCGKLSVDEWNYFLDSIRS